MPSDLTPSEPADTHFPTKSKLSSSKAKKHDIPKGLWSRCPKCGQMLFKKELEQNLKVCAHCQYHFPMRARERVLSLIEDGAFHELDADMVSVDVLKFTDTMPYPVRLQKHQRSTGLKDAAVTGIGPMGEHRVALGVLDFHFIAGSMGSVVGEKVARLIETATDLKLPLVLICASGGARMQEGTFSLMQMAKTTAVLTRHAQAGLACICVLTDPTTGGVLASFATLGTLVVAEPGALIGFTGPRVFKDAAQTYLPPGFQTAEFLAERGLIDIIVPRRELKGRLCQFLSYLTTESKPAAGVL